MESTAIAFTQLTERFHHPTYLGSDPLEFVHQENNAFDQEVVAVVAALLAYGNVRQIRAAFESVRQRLSEQGWIQPSLWADQALADPKRVQKALKGWVHRFQTAEDLVLLLSELGRERAEWGSVGAGLFSRIPEESSLEHLLNTTMQAWTPRLGKRRGSKFFLTAPKSGSACKRWCMLFRWMVRKDELDVGLWQRGSELLSKGTGLNPSELVIPLDVHTGRIAQALGLTSRRVLGWKAALEVTDSLRAFDPLDPVRFDFALCRLGIVDSCQARYVPKICKSCELYAGCVMRRQK